MSYCPSDGDLSYLLKKKVYDLAEHDIDRKLDGLSELIKSKYRKIKLF